MSGFKQYKLRLLIATKLLVLAVLAVSFASTPPNADAASSSEHLVTIHDRGETKTILTKQTTLRDALREANYELDANDMVEPGLDEELVARDYQVNIYRARPITIHDGAIKQLVMSPHQTPKQIAEDANITLQDEDIATLSLTDHIVRDGASIKMTIDRATPVTLVLYGKTQTVYTQATTIADFLDEKEIDLSKKDTLSAKNDAPIQPDMKIEIWRNGKQTVTREEPIAFEVKQIKDANRPVGYKKVTQAGVKGKKVVTYEVTMKNGKRVKSKKIQSVVIKKASQQVETIGTKHSLPPGSHKDWMRAAGIAESEFGYVNAIFSQESGWNPAAANPNGLYYGLGQTSLSRLQGACGSDWQSDPICQIKVFDSYAQSRYGTWKDAYEFKFAGADGKGAGWW
jgi:uncharacterized protein YabE (DUF348 family)